MKMDWCFIWAVLVIVRGNMGMQVADLDTEAGSVEYVHLISRNGETSIEKGMKLDPYSDEQFWPEGMGRLTTLGVLNQHQLGQWLGERYASVLNNRTYNWKTYEAYADTKDETRLSATALSQGMFISPWNDTLNTIKWIPITVMDEKSFEFDNPSCQTYEDLKRAFSASKELDTIRSRYSEVLKGAADYIGTDGRTIEFTDMIQLFNTLKIESSNNLTLQEWANSVYNSTLPEAVSLAYTLRTFTPEMKRTVGGRFLKSVVDTMAEKVNSTEKRPNVTSSSMDEMNMASVMDILGVFNSVPVPFNAVIMIELRKLQDNHTVTILFHNDTITNSEGKQDRVIHFLTLPNCTEICPFEKFKELLSPLVVEDWAQHCAEGSSADVQPPPPTVPKPECVYRFNWIQITISAIIGGVVILITIVSVCKKMAKKNSITMNNRSKTNKDQDEPASEPAAGFVISLGDMTSTVIMDPVEVFLAPYDLFTLPPPFIAPPDAGMF